PVRGRPLPLPGGRTGRPTGAAGAHRVDGGRTRHGDAAPVPAAFRRAVPPRIDPHAGGAADRRELPGARPRLSYRAMHPGPYAKAADPRETRHACSSTATNALAGISFS